MALVNFYIFGLTLDTVFGCLHVLCMKYEEIQSKFLKGSSFVDLYTSIWFSLGSLIACISVYTLSTGTIKYIHYCYLYYLWLGF